MMKLTLTLPATTYELREFTTAADTAVHPATLIGLASGGWIVLDGDHYRLTDQGRDALVEMAP